MKKLIGMALFLLALYAALLVAHPGARTAYNHYNLGKEIGKYGILCLGAGILIISGGIDLSIGSVVGVSATVLAMLLVDYHWSPMLAVGATLALGMLIGILNGVLVTGLRVQAFVVTLCGLFVYRGLARWIAADQQKGLGSGFGNLKDALAGNTDVWGAFAPLNGLLQKITGHSIEVPIALVILCILALAVTFFLHMSIYGRYLFAIGNNEKAARYSGVRVNRYKILAYALCSMFASFAAILFLMETNSARPSDTGNFFELYAIAGAVLGGCSLRGGDGTVLGILIGTSILWILPNFTRMWGVSSQLDYTVIGAALLLGAVLDELLKRRKTV
jgi:ribose transport system permease protein